MNLDSNMIISRLLHFDKRYWLSELDESGSTKVYSADMVLVTCSFIVSFLPNPDTENYFISPTCLHMKSLHGSNWIPQIVKRFVLVFLIGR